MEAGSLAEPALLPALLRSLHTLKANLLFLRLHKCLPDERLSCKIDELGRGVFFCLHGDGDRFIGPLNALPSLLSMGNKV